MKVKFGPFCSSSNALSVGMVISKRRSFYTVDHYKKIVGREIAMNIVNKSVSILNTERVSIVLNVQ